MKSLLVRSTVALVGCLLVRYGLGQAGLITSVNPLGDFESSRPPQDFISGGAPPARPSGDTRVPAHGNAPTRYTHPFDQQPGAVPAHPADREPDLPVIDSVEGPTP